METRTRNQARLRSHDENEMVGKTIGGKPAATRAALGVANGKPVDTKPTIRTTRAQELRNKMIEKKNQKISKPMAKKEVKPEPEPMEVSIHEESDQAALNEKIAEIEAGDMSEDFRAGEVVNECYQFLRYMEHDKALAPKFLADQPEVNAKMRTILVDWLVQVHKRFRLQGESLYLAIAIMDHYLSTATATKNQMQLIGITSLMMACKYEEIYSPDIEDFTYICDNAYEAEELLKMELVIFEELDFNIGFAMPIQFLRRLSQTSQDDVDGLKHALAKYLLELAMMDYDLSSLKPSILAAGALKVAIDLLGEGEWTPLMQHYSGYAAKDLDFVVPLLNKALYTAEFSKNSQKMNAIKKKFSEPKHFGISKHESITKNKEMLYEKAKKAKELLSSRK